MKKFIYSFNFFLLTTICLLNSINCICQNDSISGIKKLDVLIENKKFQEAEEVLNKNIEALISKSKFYEVTDYIFYRGKITSLLKDNINAEKDVLAFAKRITTLTTNAKALRQLQLEIGSFYENIGNSQIALKYNLKALEYTKKMPEAKGKDFGLIHSNLGVYYSRIGNLEKAIYHHKESTRYYKADNTTTNENFYINYNSLGGMMWYTSKMDSALVYYRKAEKILKTLEPNPWNKYYRSASLQNNIAGIYSIQGNTDAAILAMQKTIENLNLYLKEDVSQLTKDYAQEFLFQAIDNYAGLYKDIGNLKKAKDLLEYSFQQKKATLNPDSPETSKGKVLLGQIYLALKEYKKVEKYLDEAISEFVVNPNNYPDWLAQTYFYKAVLNSEVNKQDLARDCFEKAEDYFKVSKADYYDEVYLDFVINASSFYAKQGNNEKALKMANDAFNYIVTNQGEKTLLEYYQVLNIAEIQYQLGNYDKSLEKSELALSILNDSVFTSKTNLSKLKIETLKPSGILAKVKSEYQLNSQKDSVFLKNKLQDLKKAINILEQQKSIINTDTDISILLSNNSVIFEFAKKIALELYAKTKSKTYIKTALNFHESLLYNKIRNRLNAKQNITYGNIPKIVLEEEKEIKLRLSNSLSNTNEFDSFLKADSDWNHFIEKLKKEYPKYYNLQYASITKSISNIESNTPENKTIIRYTFIDNILYAFVINKKGTYLFELDNSNLSTLIDSLLNQNTTTSYNFKLLNTLYNILWKPLEKVIETEDVIIVPDQILFNLNFEMLTPLVINNARELATTSLLTKHTISYNYSLFLIDKNKTNVYYSNDFIAFAPEFNDKMKTDYSIALKDSITIDKTYLNLLPQPFSVDLAKEYSKLFRGDFFINDKASKQIFTKEANEHKIIHIGTHAESNNISPELSRLIFAKNNPDEDNSLYAYEIYNQNLNSNLAILTACETGKPTYQSGEGMISLAHAFNYAGSESILTSLWKIDEQSSSKIIDLFYKNLSKGMAKDKALRQAKLDYIVTAEGRTANPQYWAGLVLIGDTMPIDLKDSSNYIWHILITVFIVLIIVFFFRNRKELSK
jgi:CHAT domain-containing protein